MASQDFRGISRAASRAVDRHATEGLGIPSICLMENAGAGAARIAASAFGVLDSGVICLCGPGQNGGDAFVVARHLAVAGIRVLTLELVRGAGAVTPGDAGIQARVCRAMGIPSRQVSDAAGIAAAVGDLAHASLLVDGLFGTGLDRPLAGTAGDLVRAVNDARVPVLALDLPSGLDCDTGLPLGAAVRATRTVTFAALKLGFSNPAAAAYTGSVDVVPIGAPVPAIR